MSTYRLVNLIIPGFLAWAILFPLVSPVMERVMPGIWQCQYKALTGDPCPFCGLTGDMQNFMAGEVVEPECSLFPLFFSAWMLEVPVRLLFALLAFRSKVRNLPMWDIAIHSAGLVLLLYAAKNGILLSLFL